MLRVDKRGLISVDPTSEKKSLNGYQQAAVKKNKQFRSKLSSAELADKAKDQKAAAIKNAKDSDPEKYVDGGIAETGGRIGKIKKYDEGPTERTPDAVDLVKAEKSTSDALGSGVGVTKFLSKKGIKHSQKMNRAGKSRTSAHPYK